MKLNPATVKIFGFFSLFLSLYTLYRILFPGIVAAQVPPPYVACDKVRPDALHPLDKEFNSLRPYQASACNQAATETASFCGNRLVLTDSVSAAQIISPANASNCELLEKNLYQCTYQTHRTATYKIDLSKAKLPILGNTEDKLDDAQKTNDYLSWYLNGVTNKAENTNPTDSQIVDFSGPVNKLLPFDWQAKLRIDNINAAKVTRHDQIVVDNHRLTEWKGELSPLNRAIPYLADLLGRFISTIFPGVSQSALATAIGEPWNHRYPPLSSDYKDPQQYLKAYNEWRGNTCAIITIPVINTKQLVCARVLPIDKTYSNLFTYIPPASTEDRVGNVAVDTQNVATVSANLKISNVNLETTPAKLYFSHAEETAALAAQLQLTFLPSGVISGGAANVATNDSCDLTNIRSGPGDNLFAGEIKGNLAYDAEYSCNFQGNETEGVCKKDISVGLNVITTTPKADELWSNLVAGSGSVFKRIYPQIGEGGPLQCLADIPAATKVTYSGSGLVSAANPGERAGESAELYFPHIGSISEYFLKGIQTILRPQGFGEQVLSGQNCSNLSCSSGKIGNIPNLPQASGSCQLGSSSVKIPNELKKIIGAAAQSYKVPPSLIVGIMFGEGAFNSGKYDWTDENVRAWSMGCTAMPNCSPNSFPSQGPVPFFKDYWDKIKDASKVVDPSREPNPCNLLDIVFALAKDLKQNSSGYGDFAGKSCFGIPLKAGGGSPGSCSWDNSSAETAIKMWESGSTYACLTKENSCAAGGGMNAACPGGDNCETINRRYSNPSHNGCIWNVYSGGK